jgi:hypothetical protein
VPAYSSSAGIEAIQAYELTGRRLDDWQKDELIDACGERDDGRWAAFECAFVDPRQNGKDEIFCARELAGLFVWGEMLLGHSAHLFDTAMEHLERLVSLIEDVPEFLKRVKRVNRSHGSEGITLKSGARIRFRARTRSGSFRGFTGNCMIFNEAMDLPDPLVGSIMPVLSARSMEVPGPQVWYGASAVDQDTMPHGLVLARLREAGISGDNARLAYFEHSASVQEWMAEHGHRFDRARPELEQLSDEFLSDPAVWARANAALGRRISHEHVATEFRSPSMSARQFAIERLGVGDWPSTSVEAERVISVEAWAAVACVDPGPLGERTWAVDVAPEERAASIATAALREDGLWHVAIVEHGPGAGWVRARVKELVEEFGGRVVGDVRGPASVVLADLMDDGLVEKDDLASSQEYAQACAAFFNAVVEKRLRYPAPQPELDAALAAARTKPLEDAWKWSRIKSTTSDITPLIAATLALWGARSGDEEFATVLFPGREPDQVEERERLEREQLGPQAPRVITQAEITVCFRCQTGSTCPTHNP